LSLYLDTSLLVTALANEAETPRIRAWLGQQASETIAISHWVEAEFSAALSVKLRMRILLPAERDSSLARLAQMISDNLVVLPVTQDHFRTAARFADEYALGLRAGDALHLAIAASQRATLCTLDKRLAGAGPPLGVGTSLI
jgi:predicted nucleic acid-binding protein